MSELDDLRTRIEQLESQAQGDRLSSLPDDYRLYLADLCDIYGRSSRTISRWVRNGTLPPALWEGGRQVWLAKAVRRWYSERQDRAIERRLSWTNGIGLSQKRPQRPMAS